MAFTNPSSGPAAEINVTPLIDVLLVLLIIFMVIVPITPKGLEALVPQPAQPHPGVIDDAKPVVVQVVSTSGLPSYRINGHPIPKAEIVSELQRTFATRQEKVMFVEGDRQLNFDAVAEVVGLSHQADVANIGIVTPQMQAGH